MGRKRAYFHRKRKTIDLECLGKKQRKLYRDDGKSRFTKNEKEETEESLDETDQQTVEEHDEYFSEEETNPYEQLVATFSSKPTTAIDSDENDDISETTDDSVDEVDNEVNESDNDNSADDKLAEKIRKLEKKLKQVREDGDHGSELDDQNLEKTDDDGSGSDDDDDDDDDKLAEKIKKLEKKLKQVKEDGDHESDLDDENQEESGEEETEDDDPESSEDDNVIENDNDEDSEVRNEDSDGESEEEVDRNDDNEAASEDDDSGPESNDDDNNNDMDNVNVDSSEDETELTTKEDEESGDVSLSETDPFISHFERDLEEMDVTEMSSCVKWKSENHKVTDVGEMRYMWSCDKQKNKITHRKEKDLIQQHVKGSICQSLNKINKNGVKEGGLTCFQQGIFSILNSYQDFLYSERTSSNGEELRLVYCLHALNHVLKTRRRVLTNNAKIKQKTKSKEDFDIRDQGLTRPKVLMILPFKESALRVVKMLIQLLGESDKSLISKKKRFFEEYGLDEDEKNKHSRKPEDYQDLFTGNCDDHFRIGIGIAKKTMKLYTQFYKADIILASPLGLRTLIKSEGEKDRDYDFLSSIEVLIIDQTDVLMMQNWEHLLHLMNHIHLQPKESHGVDFSRVRMWTLNGWSKFYRQTLMFSSYSIPEVNSLFNKHCFNYAGKYVCIKKPSSGTICQVAVQVPQVFQRIDSSSYTGMPDDRFNFFIKKILPQHFDSLMAQTLIYIPSYFDFVRLRNHFTKEEIKFSSVNEYGSEKQTNTARNLFFQKLVPFMLYTERFHFFKRGYITGVRHIIFYGLPQYPHFYSEVCNMIQTTDSKSKGDNLTCTVLYTKYEAQKLSEIVGSERAGKMLNSVKCVHMFVTGDND